jgi:hypothetical protein
VGSAKKNAAENNKFNNAFEKNVFTHMFNAQ